MSSSRSIAVIGAGIAGLTCAYDLHKQGYTVTVYEKEDYVGGRMSSRTKDGLTFDIGANHLINLYEEMRGYCQELDIEWQRFPFVKYQTFTKGKLVSPFDAITWMDKIRLAIAYRNIRKVPMTYFDSSTLVDYDDENQNAYDYAKKHIGKSFADNIVETYTAVYQFHSAKEISLAALFSQLNSIKRENPEWYLHRTTGGMITLPQAMADAVDTRLGAAVEAVTAREDGKVMVKAGGEEDVYDAVVIASTATKAKKMYTNPTEAQTSVMDAAKYAPSILVAFKAPCDMFGPTEGDTSKTVSAVWIPAKESKILSSYSNEAYKGEEMIVDGKTLVIAFFREEGAREYLNAPDKEIYALAKSELKKCCPFVKNDDMLEAHDIYRWDEAMPKFYPGFLKQVKQFLDTSQGDNNVFFAGDYLNAPWTEGALRNGQRVAKAVNHRLKA